MYQSFHSPSLQVLLIRLTPKNACKYMHLFFRTFSTDFRADAEAQKHSVKENLSSRRASLSQEGGIASTFITKSHLAPAAFEKTTDQRFSTSGLVTETGK